VVILFYFILHLIHFFFYFGKLFLVLDISLVSAEFLITKIDCLPRPCRDLVRLDVLSASDPIVRVEQFDVATGRWNEVGRTEWQQYVPGLSLSLFCSLACTSAHTRSSLSPGTKRAPTLLAASRWTIGSRRHAPYAMRTCLLSLSPSPLQCVLLF
jgi:hypothetical protein